MRFSKLTAYLACAFILGTCSGVGAVNNPYGVHTFIQDIMSDDYINGHLDWALSLTGPGGYVKQLMYPVTPGTPTINPQWPKFISACYSRGMIPVIRIGTWMESGSWVKPAADAPGVYTTWANAIKNIVSQMPRNNQIPLYIEVLNECNLNIEWSGAANPTEYAQFFVQVSNAIRSLGDSRIKIMNCGLSPGGSYNNVQFVEACCNVPGFVTAFDVWACHPYPFYPPEINAHDGTAAIGAYTIDSYMAELQVLQNHGRSNVQIIATETGYALGDDGEDARADLTMRAFRDYWSKWPEVLGICPYEFCDPFGGNNTLDWVDNESGTSPDGQPTIAHKQFWSVRKLAKPWHTTGCVSCKVTEGTFGSPLSGAAVTLNPGAVAAATDNAGVFMFPNLSPGTYSLSVTKTNYTSGSATGIGLAATENEARNFSLTATAGCNITGTITDSLGGFPIQGVQVTLSPGGASTTTGAGGTYQFLGIAPAAYTLSAAKSSYYPYTSAEMTLQAGGSKTLDFHLGPGSPPSGTSLVGGTDFEYPVGPGSASGWIPEAGSGSNFVVDSTVRYSGQCSQKITPGGSDNDMVWAMSGYSAVAAGARYRIEVWCKTGAGLIGTARAIGNFYSNDMVYVGSFQAYPQFTRADGWTLFVGRGICPSFPSGSFGRLQVELRAETTAGSVWFDQAWAGYDGQSEAPLPSITGLTVTPGTLQTQFAWTNSMGTGASGTKVIYRTDRYPLTHTDGTLVQDVSGASGAALTYAQSGLTFGQRYYYGFFGHSATGANVSRPQFATAVGIDLTAPSAPVVNDGSYSTSLDTLSASWTSTDGQSGIASFRYRIGTSAGLGDVVDWTDIGTVTSVTRGGLSLTPGQRYYFTVRAQNGAGLTSSGYSDGVYAVKDCANLVQAKALVDGTAVRISGLIVSSAGAFPGAAHVQQADRACGIGVEGSLPLLSEGQAVTVTGVLSTSNGERKLTAAVVR